MRNKYLLLGAASALMLAACSEDVKGPGSNPTPAENALNLTSLSNQSGRVTLPGSTRGQKSDRLTLVAKIAPVAGAAENNWSATGIAINNGNAYVSWHSNRQAHNEATAWGGAIDVLNISELSGLAGAVNPENVILGTQVASTAKFNGIVAAGDAFYLPITSYNHGAAVGRWVADAATVDTITVPGVSANSIEVTNGVLNVVTGYEGGVYSFPAADFGAENREGVTEKIAYSKTFGGKYIDGGYVLRTNDQEMQILNSDGSVRNSGAPLVSEVKQAETYDPETGDWTFVEGTQATHYGKHTMAVDGNYIYVAGGQGANGQNGLRVYSATSCAWQNGTNTTAVTVANVDGKKLVFAATGAGLRVYEPYNSEKGELPLFAFEVYNYDANGNAAYGGPNEGDPTDKPVAGTDAHSCNFVAVDSATGLIFVACGQSGVYVFKLDTKVEVPTFATGIKAPTGDVIVQVEEGEEGSFTIPEGPEAPEGQDFAGWKGDDGEDYAPGQEVTLPAGTVIELTPVYTEHIYKYTLKFNPWLGKESEITNVPSEMKSDVNEFEIPDVTPVWGERKFWGWYTEAEWYEFDDPSVIKIGAKFSIPGDATEFTLYGVWSSRLEGSGGVEEPVTPPVEEEPVIGGDTETSGKE